MEIGGTACGLGLAGMLEAQAKSAPTGQSGKDTSVIFVWLPGGPPHMEMYDMKPEAPSDYRGVFVPRKTNGMGFHGQLFYMLQRPVCGKGFQLNILVGAVGRHQGFKTPVYGKKKE